jgi:methionyl-tRNA formyltransferase
VTRFERIAFFGTPDFALPTLQALVAAGRAPALVVTQPDRPAGRGQELREGAVARWAREEGLRVVQPPRVRDEVFQRELAPLELDLAVVVAFGQIFPAALLALPRHGCVNVHASLLPRHRGAAPAQAALLVGDEVTGVSTMVMDEGLDTGPVLLQATTTLAGHETAAELLPRLAHLGAALLLETVARLEAGTLIPWPQDPRQATLAPRLTKGDGRADWSLPAQELYRRLRGLTPWPGLTAQWRGEPVRLVWAAPVAEAAGPMTGDGPAPGTVLAVRGGALLVACGEGSVLGVERLQRSGRKPVGASDFANGERLEPGERFA